MSKNALVNTLLKLSGNENVIIVARTFVDFTGSLEAGLMLSQLLYWTTKTRIDGGWIAKSDEEFSYELCITTYGVRQAKKTLISKGILEMEIKKFNGSPTSHYRINQEKLAETFTDFINSDSADSNPVPSDSRSPLSESADSLTEITTETTTDISCEKFEKDSEPISILENDSPDNQKDFSADPSDISPEEYWKNVHPPAIRLEVSPITKENAPDRIKAAYEESILRASGKNVSIENFLTTVPENERGIARAFCVGFGRPPHKDEVSYWRKTWRKQYDIGIRPEDVEYGIECARKRNWGIRSPDTITPDAEEHSRIETMSEYDRLCETYGATSYTFMHDNQGRLVWGRGWTEEQVNQYNLEHPV
jgi:hypothetical protein